MQSRGAGPAQPAQQSGQIQLAENQQQPKPVGQAPKQSQQQRRPVVAELAEVGGVLTPKGVLVLEPSLQYAHSDVNRVTFRGIEILSSLGIGILEAVDADRDTLTASLTGRLGVTQRLELELKVPFVSRSDKESALIPQLDDDPVDSSSLDGSGIGDIEAAFHYQLNNGEDGWPYFILNGRLKLANGRGPFDVDRDDEGIGRELATGSGFYSFEPSITALYPSAPAVFFANLGYLFNISDDVDKIIGAGSDAGAQEIGKVDPGDAVRMSFGMGYSINERAAFTLGFKNDWIQATKTTINGVELSSSQLNIGSILMGYSYQLKPNVGINLNLEFGITDDAPDMLMTFRMPFSNKVF
ncbi:transporter [Motiliproteus coralliicola]|uniref:Transporter n=2 Tax=Motiliproteus coralliicola TaxID=2283196 RepID=A0A369WBT3_9GAMM|nr:transporter [Motiliproteus coralliicola]